MSNIKQYPTYSVAIRTLGKAGFLYDVLIRSLKAQTVAPENIYVYIAEGYNLPTPIADEKYIYCKKGMAAQRALDFEEIDSEFILLFAIYLVLILKKHMFRNCSLEIRNPK